MKMKRAIWLALAVALLPQASFAADQRKIETSKTFERRINENWVVLGISYPNRERNDACIAWKEWRDGSQIELTKDLKDGEFYIWNQTMTWNRINDEKAKAYPLRMTFYDQSGGVVDSGTSDYRLVNKNTITIPSLSEKKFLTALVNSNRLLFIPEGNVGNIQVYFDGKANEIAIALSDCVREASKSQPPSAAKRDAAIEPPSLDIPKKTNARDTL